MLPGDPGDNDNVALNPTESVTASSVEESINTIPVSEVQPFIHYDRTFTNLQDNLIKISESKLKGYLNDFRNATRWAKATEIVFIVLIPLAICMISVDKYNPILSISADTVKAIVVSLVILLAFLDVFLFFISLSKKPRNVDDLLDLIKNIPPKEKKRLSLKKKR